MINEIDKIDILDLRSFVLLLMVTEWVVMYNARYQIPEVHRGSSVARRPLSFPRPVDIRLDSTTNSYSFGVSHTKPF